MSESVNYPSSKPARCGCEVVGIRINGQVIEIKHPDGSTEECTMEVEIGGNLMTYADMFGLKKKAV